MKIIKNIIFVLTALSLLFVSITSCSDNDAIDNGVDNGQDGEQATLVTIAPTIEWGINSSDVKAKQNKSLSLSLSTDTLLRFANESKGITLDYKFNDDKLVATSMTQANISSINNVVKGWLKGYNELASSETSLLYTSKDNVTLAYGKILQGSENPYASVAWTYIDAEEESLTSGPDYSPSGTENGHDYIDLGIGIGWATQNVGASSPEKTGGYYMWGETTTSSNCWWWYYSLYKGSSSSYLDEDKFYTPYSNISGTKYDAAKVKMGGNWRMPTRAEMSSLINNCEITVGTMNDTEGFIVTGPSGKSIFIPKTGRQKKEDIQYKSSSTYMWSSTTDGKQCAYYLSISSKGKGSITFEDKYYGFTIRGVVDLK